MCKGATGPLLTARAPAPAGCPRSARACAAAPPHPPPPPAPHPRSVDPPSEWTGRPGWRASCPSFSAAISSRISKHGEHVCLQGPYYRSSAAAPSKSWPGQQCPSQSFQLSGRLKASPRNRQGSQLALPTFPFTASLAGLLAATPAGRGRQRSSAPILVVRVPCGRGAPFQRDATTPMSPSRHRGIM